MKMNRRPITLGVSVIALALAGPGQASAGVLGEIGSRLPDTNVAANVQANVKANAAAPLELPKKGSHGDGGSDTSVKANGEAGSTGSEAGAGLDGRAGGSRLGARAGIEQSARAKGIAGEHETGARLTAVGRGGAKLGAGRHRHGVSAKGKSRAAAKARSRSLSGPSSAAPTDGGPTKDVVPLRGIGREVGNPIQLSLAGWLIALTGAACLGASRIIRRLQRARL
jgi:hypothetical protein